MADGYLEIKSTSGYIATPDSDVGSLGNASADNCMFLFDVSLPDWDVPTGDDVAIAGKNNEFLIQAKVGGANGAWRTQVWDNVAQLVNDAQDSATTFNVLSGRNFIRIDVDATNGDCDYYYKTDTTGDLTTLTGWTARDSFTFTAIDGARYLRDTANNLRVGSHNYKTGVDGLKIYRAVVYRDLTGTDEWFDLDLRSGDWSDLGTGHNDGANTWTAVGTVTTDWQYVAATVDSQTARPASDITTTGWTTSTGTDYYALLDEATASDTDYIQGVAS